MTLFNLTVTNIPDHLKYCALCHIVLRECSIYAGWGLYAGKRTM